MKTSLLLLLLFWFIHSHANTFQNCMDANSGADPQTMEICDSALASPDTTIDEKSRIYISQANYLSRNNRFNEAEKILDDAFNLNPKNLENGRYRYNWLRTKGHLYFAQEEYTNALPFYKQALEVARIIGDTKVIAITYNDLGAVHLDMDKYHEALEWLQKSLELKYQLAENYGIAFSLANIAEVYVSLGENQKAQEYYNLSLASHQKSLANDNEGNSLYEAAVAKVHQSLGLLQISLKNYADAKSNLDAALGTYQKLNLKGQEVTVLSAMGKMYLEQDQMKLALELLQQANQLEATLESQDNLDLKVNRVNAYIRTAQWHQAESVAVDGLKQAMTKNTLDRQMVFLDQLAII